MGGSSSGLSRLWLARLSQLLPSGTPLVNSQSGFMANVLNAFVLVLGVIVAGTLGYWIQDRDIPAKIVEYRVVTPRVEQGGVVKIIYVLERVKYCKVHVEQVIYDHQNIRYPGPDLDFAIDPGRQKMGRDEVGMATKLPDWFSPGTAIHRAVRAYYCNPLQRVIDWPVVLIGPDLEFEVTPATDIPMVRIPLK